MKASAPHTPHPFFDLIIPCFLIFVLVVCIAAGIIAHIHTSDIDRSLSDRVLLLEKQMNERVIPRINIERATVYNGEGEIVVEKIEKEKRR